MTGRERVIKTITFSNPDRIPTDLWVLPAARAAYGAELDRLIWHYGVDIASVDGPFDISFDKRHYEPGEFVDLWGSKWRNIQAGLVGEVKCPVLQELEEVRNYRAPIALFNQMWEDNLPLTRSKIAKAHTEGKFVIGGWLSVFERMQFLRGTENLYCDLAMKDEDLSGLADVISTFFNAYLDKWLLMDVDAMVFGDDWGSQRSLLISKPMWIEFFKPIYAQLMDRIKAAGKYVFFHSDGNIMDLYDQFIELGVSAINSQLWCMGVENVAKRFAGKITFWGEICRQQILPNGTSDDVAHSKAEMVQNLFVNGGGLIGESEVNKDVPLKNIEELLKPWVSQNEK